MDLTQVLLNCHSPVETIRCAAEQQLRLAQEHDIAQFLRILAEELCSESKHEVSRQLAGLLLKNTVSGNERKIDTENRNRWLSLEPSVTAPIKKAVLDTLRSNSDPARGAACQVIAKVGRLELPSNRWPELMPCLISYITGDSAVSKRAALTALGYLCEDARLLEHELETVIISEDVSNQILTAVVQGVRDNDIETKYAAIRALYFALVFARSNFKNEVERNLIIQIVCDSCEYNLERIQTAAFECLVLMASEYYEFISPYMGTLAPLTLKAVKGSSEPVAIFAMEFWNTLGDMELDYMLDEPSSNLSCNYIKQAQSVLLPILFETLARQSEADEMDLDSWTISKAAGACLSICAQVLKDEILDQVLAFVHANFANPDWRHREAALLAYGSIMEGPSLLKLQPIVDSSITNLCQALSDTSVAVRDTCAWTIGRIATFHPNAVIKLLGTPQGEAGLIAVLIERMNDEPRVASNICWVIHQLADNGLGSSGLDLWFTKLVKVILDASQRPDAEECHLRQACFNTLSMLITSCGPSCVPALVSLSEELLSGNCGLEKLLQIPLPHNHQVSTAICLICGVLHSIITRLGTEAFPICDRLVGCFSRILALYIPMPPCQPMTPTNNQLSSSGSCEEVLLALSAVIGVMGDKFITHLETVAPLILNTLRLKEEAEVCRIGVELVGDISRAVGQASQNFSKLFLLALCELLTDANVSRKIKPSAIISIGDMAMALGQGFAPYLDTLQLLQQAAGTKYSDGPTHSEEWVDYLGELRDAVLQAYIGIIYGMKDAGKLEDMASYVPGMITFMGTIVDDYSEYPIDSNLKTSINLTGDLITAYNGQIIQYLMEEKRRLFLETMMRVGEQTNNSDIVQNVAWLRSLVSKASVSSGII